jgi:hypothetical protein
MGLFILLKQLLYYSCTTFCIKAYKLISSDEVAKNVSHGIQKPETEHQAHTVVLLLIQVCHGLLVVSFPELNTYSAQGMVS